ncbi:amino acid kinase family protein, partial [Sutterella seckii]
MEEKKNAAPLVVKLSGKALGAEKELERLCRELEAAGRAFLLVHGGGVAVDRLMADLGIEVRRVRGLRVSPAEEMPLIAGVARRHLQSGAPVRRRAGGLSP